MKGTLPGAALPPCRRPQHCSQSRGRPPPGAGLSPGLSPRDQPQGVTPGNNPREPTRRSSGAATISPSAATQRNPKTPKGEASADQSRQRQGNDGRTCLPPRFRPFSVRPSGVPAGRDGTHRRQPAPRQRPRQRPGNPADDGGINLRQRNPVAAAVAENRPASPGDIADQRHGLNPGHDERHSPRRCIAALSPTAALQSVPGTPAARRRINRRASPRQRPGEPTRRSSGVATISPSAATQRNPKTPKGEASASQGRQGQGNDGRTYLPPRFRPFSVRPSGVTRGTGRDAPQSGSRHHDNIRNNARGVTAENPQTTAGSTSGSGTR